MNESQKFYRKEMSISYRSFAAKIKPLNILITM